MLGMGGLRKLVQNIGLLAPMNTMLLLEWSEENVTVSLENKVIINGVLLVLVLILGMLVNELHY